MQGVNRNRFCSLPKIVSIFHLRADLLLVYCVVFCQFAYWFNPFWFSIKKSWTDNLLNMDDIRRRYTTPVNKVETSYKSSVSLTVTRRNTTQYESRRSSFLLSKVDETDELEEEDPFEEFHLTPEKRMIKNVNNLRWKVDGSGRNRAQSLIDQYIDVADPDLNRIHSNRAFFGIHTIRRRNKGRWSLFNDDDDEVRKQTLQLNLPKFPQFFISILICDMAWN